VKRFGHSRYARRGPAPQLMPDQLGLSPLEGQIAGQIVQALRLIGCTVSSTQQRRRSKQTIGLPDLYAVHEAWGVRCWIEVKTPEGRVSRAQQAWHDAERAAGGIVLVCRSAEDALEQIAALPRRRTG
jgi:VRR-NUC domain